MADAETVKLDITDVPGGTKLQYELQVGGQARLQVPKAGPTRYKADDGKWYIDTPSGLILDPNQSDCPTPPSR